MITAKKILEILQRKEPRHPKDVAQEIYLAGRTFTESHWLHFEMKPKKEGQSTFSWDVYSNESGVKLGYIKWYGFFKCYSFFAEPNTVFEPTCLTDITNFIHTQMRQWREEKKQTDKN